MAHEDFSRKDTVKPSSDRSFGLVVAAFLLIVACWPLIYAQPIRWWALGIAIIIAILAVRWPAVLAPLNKRWIKLGLLLQRFVNPIVLGFVFYATVTPIALLMRLLGKDPLRLRADAHAASYWIDRVPPGPAPQSMKNQF